MKQRLPQVTLLITFLLLFTFLESCGEKETSKGRVTDETTELAESVGEAFLVNKLKSLKNGIQGVDINEPNSKDEGLTALHYGCTLGNLEIIQVLLDSKANINAKDEHGWTPLHEAAYKGHKQVVTILLDAGADVNAEDKDGITALHLATKFSYNEIGLILLKNGAKVNVKSKIAGWTPLHYAAVREHSKIMLEALLTHGADVNLQNKHGQNPFDLALFNGSPQEILLTLLKNGTKVDRKDEYGRTSLHLAVTRGDRDDKIILDLLSKGLDVNARDNRERKTPLHEIAYQYVDFNPIAFAALLSNGADINARDIEGKTPLHYVVGYRDKFDPIAVAALLHNGADVNARDIENRTPLHIVILTMLNGHENIMPKCEEIVKMLLEEGADASIKDNAGKTVPQMILQSSGFSEVKKCNILDHIKKYRILKQK